MDNLTEKNIVLIGFMGSGKSSIAKRLAQELQKEWIDSDSHIQNSQNCDIPSIFREHGEAYFRTLESKFIESFAAKSGYIISTGGGLPIFNDTKKLGIRFYLKSDFHILASRIQNDSKNIRPLFSDLNHAHTLYKERAKIYELQSDEIINANNDLDSVTKEILNLLQKYGYTNAKN